jgi:arsenite methyltransferase
VVKGRQIPQYGVDAPSVVISFYASALVLLACGVALFTYVDRLQSLIVVPILLVAAVFAVLGTSMLVYSFIGKHRLRDHLLRQRKWRGNEVVLDIGAGRGLMAIGAAQRAPMGKTIALDIWNAKDLSGNTPQALEENAAIEAVEGRIQIVTGDARQLDMPDSSIDAVLSLFCIHNIQPPADRRKVCHEIARVLKPGGTVMIADFPGVERYVDFLRDAGLTVVRAERCELIALGGIAGYLVAQK